MKQPENLTDNMLELIKQPYPITMAIHRFTLQEERVLDRVFEALKPQINELSHINDDGTHLRYYTPTEVGKTNLGDTYINIPVNLLATEKNHFEVKKALKMLTKRFITICNRNDKGELVDEVFTNIFMEAKFPKNAQKAKIKISQELMPQFLEQARFMASGEDKDNYTQLHTATFFKTSSKHVINLYKYISHFRDKKVVYCSLDSFKKYMNIESSYKTISDIKRRVILPAMKELKAKAYVWFDIAERVTRGRKFIGWKFNIYTKDDPKPKATTPEQIPLTSDNIAQKEAEIRAQQQDLERLKRAKKEADYREKLTNFFKLTETQADKLSTLYANGTISGLKLDQLLENIERKASSIDNIGAYTVQVLSKQLNINL